MMAHLNLENSSSRLSFIHKTLLRILKKSRKYLLYQTAFKRTRKLDLTAHPLPYSDILGL